jgi:hypothetical protein
MWSRTHLDLVDINPLVLLLHLLVGDPHGIHRGHLCGSAGVDQIGRSPKWTHSVFQILSGHARLLHVECLLLELHELTLVHALLFQCSQGSLLDGRL